MSTIIEGNSSNLHKDDISSMSSDVASMKKMLMETKDDSGKSIWAFSLETFGMVDGGKKRKDDVMCFSFDDAIKVFTELIEDKAIEWTFEKTPFDDFSSNKDDLIQAFVHWSHKIDDDSKNVNEPIQYNLSKAYRRLVSYVEWMDKNCKEMNLNGSTMKEIANVWKMKCTHDKHGRLIWWFDLEDLDLKHIKANVASSETLRYLIWFAHLVLFDKRCQQNGFVIVESVGKASFIELMSSISTEVKAKFDRLTIGVLPIKMKSLIIVHGPTWFRVLLAFMSPFMGAKLRKRIKIIPNKIDPKEYLEETVGKESIPVGFAQLQGRIEKDIVFNLLDKLTD
jgi:CRAL/TRIO domain